jgi:hypothetical protein
MKLYFTLIFFISFYAALGQIDITARYRYLDSTIAVDHRNIPLEKTTFFFPTKFFPDYQFSSNSINSNSLIISCRVQKSSDSLRMKDTSCLYSTPLPGTIDSLSLKHYSKQLYALKEPLLYNVGTNKEAYRFTLLRTFQNPISVRIERDGDEIWIYTKVGSGASGFEPGFIKRRRKRKLKMEEWEEFKRRIDRLDYWNMLNVGEVPGVDGTTWILEGSTPDLYSVISTWQFEKRDDYKAACIYLLEISKVKVNKKNID